MEHKDSIDSLYKMVKETGAGEGHIKYSGIKKNPKATAVISVYYEQRPSHDVLDELYDWAEENNMKDITSKIEELSKLEEDQE